MIDTKYSDEVHNALESLVPEDRNILFMVIDDMTFKEISVELGVTIPFVRTRLSRIREKIKLKLKPKILVVGQAPSSEPKTDLSSPTWVRFKYLSGTDDKTFHQWFRIINLNRRFPGTSGHGHTFDMEEGLLCAKIVCMNPRSHHIVLLGANVALCFRDVLGEREPESVEEAWCSCSGSTIHVIPHPSPVNRFWNDASNVERASGLVRLVMRRHASHLEHQKR